MPQEFETPSRCSACPRKGSQFCCDASFNVNKLQTWSMITTTARLSLKMAKNVCLHLSLLSASPIADILQSHLWVWSLTSAVFQLCTYWAGEMLLGISGTNSHQTKPITLSTRWVGRSGANLSASESHRGLSKCFLISFHLTAGTCEDQPPFCASWFPISSYGQETACRAVFFLFLSTNSLNHQFLLYWKLHWSTKKKMHHHTVELISSSRKWK